MEVVRHKGTPAVTKIVTITEAKPVTYDLTGLSKEQAALIAILLGNASHSVAGNMYGKMLEALDIDNDYVYSCIHGEKGLDRIETTIVTHAHIAHIVNNAR